MAIQCWFEFVYKIMFFFSSENNIVCGKLIEREYCELSFATYINMFTHFQHPGALVSDLLPVNPNSIPYHVTCFTNILFLAARTGDYIQKVTRFTVHTIFNMEFLTIFKRNVWWFINVITTFTSFVCTLLHSSLWTCQRELCWC